MRRFALGLCAAAAGLVLGAHAALAGGTNPDGYGIYTPGPRLPDGTRLYRHDPRTWYYGERGYYPYYGSGYWVPRAQMKTRYRYKYLGPRYRYYPAWGYD
ncbi:MAG: hypothetical protein NW223_23185 [Hyphomicrobiaceae bacterium]|nr:hypothetical protein [Hyphomicrobiaceae bacterium]